MNKSTFDKYIAYARPLTGSAHDYYFDAYIIGLNVYYARLKKLKTQEKHEAALQRAKKYFQSPESADGISDGLEGKRPLDMPTGHNGNQNATKADKFDTNMVVACMSSEKGAWDAYARRNGYRSLAALVRERMKGCT